MNDDEVTIILYIIILFIAYSFKQIGSAVSMWLNHFIYIFGKQTEQWYIE